MIGIQRGVFPELAPADQILWAHAAPYSQDPVLLSIFGAGHITVQPFLPGYGGHALPELVTTTHTGTATPAVGRWQNEARLYDVVRFAHVLDEPFSPGDATLASVVWYLHQVRRRPENFLLPDSEGRNRVNRSEPGPISYQADPEKPGIYSLVIEWVYQFETDHESGRLLGF